MLLSPRALDEHPCIRHCVPASQRSTHPSTMPTNTIRRRLMKSAEYCGVGASAAACSIQQQTTHDEGERKAGEYTHMCTTLVKASAANTCPRQDRDRHANTYAAWEPPECTCCCGGGNEITRSCATHPVAHAVVPSATAHTRALLTSQPVHSTHTHTTDSLQGPTRYSLRCHLLHTTHQGAVDPRAGEAVLLAVRANAAAAAPAA